MRSQFFVIVLLFSSSSARATDPETTGMPPDLQEFALTIQETVRKSGVEVDTADIQKLTLGQVNSIIAAYNSDDFSKEEKSEIIEMILIDPDCCPGDCCPLKALQ